MRPRVAGIAAAGLLEDELAVLVEPDELFRLDAARADTRLDAELGQPAHGVRQQVDADAERLQLGGRFVHAASNARLVQAGLPVTDHGNVHRGPRLEDQRILEVSHQHRIETLVLCLDDPRHHQHGPAEGVLEERGDVGGAEQGQDRDQPEGQAGDDVAGGAGLGGNRRGNR